jgi:hypothetical protein
MDGIRKSLAYLTKGCLHEFTMIAALSPTDWRNGAKEATPLVFNRAVESINAAMLSCLSA